MRALLAPPRTPASRIVHARVPARVEPPGWYAWCPFPGGSDVLCVERTTADPAPHLHGRLQLSLVQRPTVSTDARGDPHPALPRALLVVNPHALHSDGPLGTVPWYVREIHVGPALLDAVRIGLAGGREGPAVDPGACVPTLWAHGGAPQFPRRVVDDDPLSGWLNALWNGMRDDGETHAPSSRSTGTRALKAVALERESQLIRCLAALVARHAQCPLARRPMGRRDAGVGRAREYLHAHVTDYVALADLAGVAGLNKFYLIRAFEREVGIPPHAYQTQLRLARARRLIEAGEPLSHVAFDVGFADQSHLTRRFKALFGVTPGQYARCGKGATAAASCPRRMEHGSNAPA